MERPQANRIDEELVLDVVERYKEDHHQEVAQVKCYDSLNYYFLLTTFFTDYERISSATGSVAKCECYDPTCECFDTRGKFTRVLV